MGLKLPSGIVLVLGILGGLLVAFNEASFGFALDWKYGITVAITALGILVSPLIGANFRNALHLDPRVAVGIGTLLVVLQVAVLTLGGISPEVHGVIAGVIAMATILGFGPTVTQAVAERMGIVTVRTVTAPAKPAVVVERSRLGTEEPKGMGTVSGMGKSEVKVSSPQQEQTRNVAPSPIVPQDQKPPAKPRAKRAPAKPKAPKAAK